MYQRDCVSIMKREPEIMKPVPPITCGVQKKRVSAAGVRLLKMPGRAVMPEIQKMVAPRSWEREARKPMEWRWWARRSDLEGIHIQGFGSGGVEGVLV